MVFQHNDFPETEVPVEQQQEGQEQVQNVESQMETLKINENDVNAPKELARIYKKMEKKRGKHMRKVSHMEKKYLSDKSCLENRMQFHEDLLYRKVEKKTKKIEKKITKLEEKRQKQLLLLKLISGSFPSNENGVAPQNNEPQPEGSTSMQANGQQGVPMEQTASA